MSLSEAFLTMTIHATSPRRFATLIRAAVSLLAGAAAAAALAAPSAAAEPRCSRQAESALAAVGIDRSDIRDLNIITILGSQEMGTVAEYQAWATLRSCTGSVVVRMRYTCGIIDTYARGTCEGQVSGLR